MHRTLPVRPDLLGAQRVVERALALEPLCHARDRAQVVGERPQNQRRLLAFGAQPREYPQRAAGVAAQRRAGELEHVEARAVSDERTDLVERCGPGRRQECDALDLLLRSEQIALDAIGNELGGILLDDDALLCKTAQDPRRQVAARYGFGHHEHAGLLKGGDPGILERLAIHDTGNQQHGVRRRLLDETLQHAAALRVERA